MPGGSAVHAGRALAAERHALLAVPPMAAEGFLVSGAVEEPAARLARPAAELLQPMQPRLVELSRPSLEPDINPNGEPDLER